MTFVMSMARYYNIMIVPDGVESSFGIKLRSWVFKGLIGGAVVLTVCLILFFVFYGHIISRAARTDQLARENEALKRYKYKLLLLEENMKETQKIVSKISSLAGVDFKIPELPPDSVLFAAKDKPAVVARSVVSPENIPSGLPLEGYMTRGFSDNDENYHPGVDIAAEVGTPVLATATGKVVFAGADSTYGLMVILEHENNISTVYGHNSELLVEMGQEVLVGGRIALSGNTGRSTAPHLHYEIRENGKPVNPLKYIMDDEVSVKQE